MLKSRSRTMLLNLCNAMAIAILLVPPVLQAAPIPIDDVKRAEPVSFEKEIFPILQRNCLSCHSASEREGDLVLESPQGILKGGDTGPAAIPGKGSDSLILRVASHQSDPVMPPAGNDVAAKNLTPAELGLLKLWIDQGAKGSGGIDSLSPTRWQPLPAGLHPVHALALTEDGQYAAVSRANQIFLYHIPTGTLVTRLSDPALAQFMPQSTPVDPQVKSGTVNGGVQVASGGNVEASSDGPGNGPQVVEITGIAHRDLVQSLAINVDGDLLASGSYREVKLWRRPRDVTRRNIALGGKGTAVAVSSDNQWIAIATDKPEVKLFKVADGQPGPVLTGHTDRITSLRFSEDSQQLYSSSIDQTVRLWNVPEGKPLGIIETSAPVNAVELVSSGVVATDQPPTSPILITGHADNLVRVWQSNLSNGTAIPNVLANLERTTTSPDGSLLAMVDNAGSVRVLSLFEVEGTPVGRELATWKIERGITALTFVRLNGVPTPTAELPAQGYVLATGSTDGSIRVWSLPEHQLIQEWRGDAVAVKAISSSADGKLLATGLENGAMTQWDLAATLSPPPVENEVIHDSQSPVTLTALSPSKKLLAVVGVKDGQPAIYVRNLETQQLIAAFKGHVGAVRSLAFTSDETGLLSGGDDKSIRLWNLQNPTEPEKAKLDALPSAVTAVAASGDGTQWLAGFADNSLRLYNPAGATPEEIVVREFSGNSGAILAAGYFNGQPYSVSADKSVRFWNAADGSQTRTFNMPAAITSFTISGDGQRMAFGGDDKQVRIVQTDNGTVVQTLPGFQQTTTSLAFSADNQHLSVLSSGGELSRWQLSSQRLLEASVDANQTTLFQTADVASLMVGDKEGRILKKKFRFQSFFDGNTQPVTDLLYHPNGSVLLMTGADGSFRGYNAQDAQATFATNHGAAVHDLAISADGNTLSTAGENAQVRLWNISGGAVGPQQLTGFAGPVFHTCFSSNGTRLFAATGGEKPAVLLFDLASGQLIERFSEASTIAIGCEPVPALPGIDAAQQPARVYIATADGIVQRDSRFVRAVPGHSGPVTSLAAVPGSPRQVFSGSVDGTIRRWNLDNSQTQQQFNHGGPVNAIAVRSDGQRIASASENRTAKLFNINGQQVAEMRGDVRRRVEQTRAQQQVNAANARLNVAKQLLQQAEQDLPTKTNAEKTLSDNLAKANQDVTDKKGVVDKALAEKIAAEKLAIEASATAKAAMAEKETAELAAKEAATAMQVVQAKMQRLQQAASGDPQNEELKKLVASTMVELTMCQQTMQQTATAVQAPTQKSQQMATLANTAAQKVATVQKPYNDALDALRISEANQNLLSQQQALAAKELKAAQELVPIRKEAVTKSEVSRTEAQVAAEVANKLASEADLAIRAIQFSPDGRTLLTVGDYTSVHTWDAETGGALSAFAGHTGPVVSALFIGEGEIVSISEDLSARLWETNPEWILDRTIGTIDDPNIIVHRVTAVDFNADSTQLLVAGGVPSRSGELQVIQVSDGKRILYLPQAHDDVIYSARFSPDGKRIASGGADKYLRTFDVSTSQQLRRFEGHTNYVLGVDWKGDGQVIVTAGADNVVKVWDAETADQQRTIENQFTKHVTGVQYIGETDSIVTSCGDKIVRMHNSSNGGLERNFGEIRVWPHCVACTPDRNVVVAGDAMGTVTIWNGQNGQFVRRLETPMVPAVAHP
ncbi:MAG: c-type cytochrome domain-containing protein [Planctomycetaceae bacterium]